MKSIQFLSAASRLVVMIAAVALTPVGGIRSACAGEVNTQTAEVLALLTAVHELTSYNGDIATRNAHLEAWRQLWAEDATFVVNNSATFTGRDDIMAFFAGAGFFNNNWIALSPSFRTEVAIHGNTAEVYLECIFLNESKTIVAERALSGTIRKVKGQWLFWRMNTDPAQPLF